ncbi:MAG TPA: formate dehydrogenase accessory sulfurtransferase FdhD [Acetobacteraceae bacterium]|nr:formate dehydrogenase accessory sulfurtransferase FdhD [Acetobacteraceae bacterium]
MAPLPEPLRRVEAVAYRHGGAALAGRTIPEEIPVAFTYDRATYAVMMASPVDLGDFASGFTLSEGIVERVEDITSLEIVSVEQGIECRMSLVNAAQERVAARRRRIAGPVGCGLCGIESLTEAARPIPRVGEGVVVTPNQIMQAMREMPRLQALNRESHGVHAAAFFDPRAGHILLREDVGRHNALDKLIGAVVREGMSGPEGVVLLTSRVSIELIQKTAMLGASILVAVSVPTAHALRMAEAAGITLAAIARDDGFEVFTHQARIAPKADFPEAKLHVA